MPFISLILSPASLIRRVPAARADRIDALAELRGDRRVGLTDRVRLLVKLSDVVGFLAGAQHERGQKQGFEALHDG
jgi:hypothetical protein